MTGYIIAFFFGLSALGGGYGYLMAQKNKSLLLDNAVVRGELTTCGLRLDNILEDVRDDNAVDNLTDDDLRDVPDHWLRPAGDSSGN